MGLFGDIGGVYTSIYQFGKVLVGVLAQKLMYAEIMKCIYQTEKAENVE